MINLRHKNYKSCTESLESELYPKNRNGGKVIKPRKDSKKEKIGEKEGK